MPFQFLLDQSLQIFDYTTDFPLNIVILTGRSFKKVRACDDASCSMLSFHLLMSLLALGSMCVDCLELVRLGFSHGTASWCD